MTFREAFCNQMKYISSMTSFHFNWLLKQDWNQARIIFLCILDREKNQDRTFYSSTKFLIFYFQFWVRDRVTFCLGTFFVQFGNFFVRSWENMRKVQCQGFNLERFSFFFEKIWEIFNAKYSIWNVFRSFLRKYEKDSMLSIQFGTFCVRFWENVRKIQFGTFFVRFWENMRKIQCQGEKKKNDNNINTASLLITFK